MVGENLRRCHFTPLQPGLALYTSATDKQHSQLPSLSSKTTQCIHTTWIPPRSLYSTTACSTSGALTRTCLASRLQRPSPQSPRWILASLLPTSNCHSPLQRQQRLVVLRALNPHHAPCLDVAGRRAESLGSAASRGRAPVRRRK